MRICAVTVLYNPDSSVLEYIQTYLHQVDALYVVDNSENRSSEVTKAIRTRFPGNKVNIIQNNSNRGVATALNQGFQLACDEGYDWVLSMDQDSYFDTSLFFELSAPLLGHQNIGIIAASYRQKHPFQKPYSTDFHKYLFVVTSGNLVNVHAWKKVGGFDERLFIDEVDNDFCIRLTLNHYLVIGSARVFLKHGLGEAFSIHPFFLSRPMPLGIHSPLRVSYAVRNRLYLTKKYFLRQPLFSFNRIYHNMMLLGFIIFFYPQKRKYMHAFFRGIVDFLSSR